MEARVPTADDRVREELDALTDREREVVVAVAQGKSDAAIAAELFMSEATVKTHIPGRSPSSTSAARCS